MAPRKRKNQEVATIVEPEVVVDAVPTEEAPISKSIQAEVPTAPVYTKLTAMEFLTLIDNLVKKQISALTVRYTKDGGLEGNWLYGSHPYSSDVLREMVRLGTTAAAYLQGGRMQQFDLVVSNGKLPRYSMHVASE